MMDVMDVTVPPIDIVASAPAWWATLVSWADWAMHWIGRIYGLISVVCIVYYAAVPRGKYPRVDRALGLVTTVALDLWNLRERWKQGGLALAATVVDEAKNRTVSPGPGAGPEPEPAAVPDPSPAAPAPPDGVPPPLQPSPAALSPSELPTPSEPVTVDLGVSNAGVAGDADPRATSLYNPAPESRSASAASPFASPSAPVLQPGVPPPPPPTPPPTWKP